jgi:pimeloyl-ACP methyl ester carboxylesterase
MTSLTPAAASDLFRQDPDRFLDVGEGEVALRTVGTGPDVLFVHGWPVSGATFRLLLPHLVDHVTCHVIDLPSAGSSRFTAADRITIDQHIETVRRVIDQLELDDVAVVGHDSGGMIARHAMASDARLRSMGLINTEQPQGMSWRFRSFLMGRHLPGFGAGLGWAAGQPKVRRLRPILGDAFVDSSLLDGEFDEFFLQPLHRDPVRRAASIRALKSFKASHVDDLGAIHRRIGVPVALVWGDQDPFFPVARAREMVGTFADAHLTEIAGAGLFSHEERPAEVAAALLPTLIGEGPAAP